MASRCTFAATREALDQNQTSVPTVTPKNATEEGKEKFVVFEKLFPEMVVFDQCPPPMGISAVRPAVRPTWRRGVKTNCGSTSIANCWVPVEIDVVTPFVVAVVFVLVE